VLSLRLTSPFDDGSEQAALTELDGVMDRQGEPELGREANEANTKVLEQARVEIAQLFRQLRRLCNPSLAASQATGKAERR